MNNEECTELETALDLGDLDITSRDGFILDIVNGNKEGLSNSIISQIETG